MDIATNIPLDTKLSVYKYLPLESTIKLPEDVLYHSLITTKALRSKYKSDTWLLEYAARKGIILITKNTGAVIDGIVGENEYLENARDYIWKLGLPQGWYKIKLMPYGFDVVGIGREYFTDQDNWENNGQRQYELKTITRDLPRLRILRTYGDSELIRKSSVFILFDQLSHNYEDVKSYEFNVLNSKSEMKLCLVKNNNNLVIGYRVICTCGSFHSFYPPINDVHTLNKYFCPVWYRGKNDSTAIGVSITGGFKRYKTTCIRITVSPFIVLSFCIKFFEV